MVDNEQIADLRRRLLAAEAQRDSLQPVADAAIAYVAAVTPRGENREAFEFEIADTPLAALITAVLVYAATVPPDATQIMGGSRTEGDE